MNTDEKRIRAYLEQVAETIQALPLQPLEEIYAMLSAVRQAGGCVFTLGNGGSGSTAGLLAGELLHAAEDRPLRSLCLSESGGCLLDASDRAGYENVFVLPLQRLAAEGDGLLALSGSGNSPNVLAAVQAASRLGVRTSGMAGFSGGKLQGQTEICLVVPSRSMTQIEDVFVVAGHALAAALAQPQADPAAVMQDYLDSSAERIAALPAGELAPAAAGLRLAQRERRRAFLAGDGAAIYSASHTVNDLMKATLKPGLPRMQAHCLGDNEALLTALANDVGYAAVFAEPLRSLAQPGDMLLLYALKDADESLHEAVQAASQLQLDTVVFTAAESTDAWPEQGTRVLPLAIADRSIALDAFAVLSHALTTAMIAGED